MSDQVSGIEGQQVKRLSGRTSAVGGSMGMSTLGMALFGLPFVGAGIWVMLMGAEVLKVDPSGVHAPMWVITVFGLVFFCAGLMVWGMGWNQARREKLRKQHALLFLGEPAMEDYPWDSSRYIPQRWIPVVKVLGGAIFMTVFLSMFNWWAFWSDDSVIFVKVIVSIFDVILILVWFSALKSVLHAIKFGKTRLEFGQFPYNTGDWFQAKIQLPSGLERVEGAKLVFRCVREFYEVRGAGKNRKKRMVHEQLWAEEQVLSGAEIGQWPRFLNATFTIPPTAPGTCIASEKPIFWELEMELAVPGIDLTQQYLVPVYEKAPEA